MKHAAPLVRLLSTALSFVLGICLTAFAFEVPVNPKSVHEAYVLGQRNDKQTGDFFAQYMREIAQFQEGPHITQVELLTPFAQIMDASRKNTAGYSEEQAMKDYQQRGDTIVVHIMILLPSAYPPAANNPNASGETPSPEAKRSLYPENFWEKFQFNLKQHDRNVPMRASHNQPIYSAPTKEAPSALDGENVWLEYDAKNVAQEEATVEVITLDGKTIRTTFDLKKLR